MSASPIIRGFRPHTIRDQIRFLPSAARLRVPAFKVISRVQDFTPGEQILGTAVALIAMCESANLSMSDVLQTASNALHDAEAPFTSHVAAIREYANREIARGEEVRGGAY